MTTSRHAVASSLCAPRLESRYQFVDDLERIFFRVRTLVATVSAQERARISRLAALTRTFASAIGTLIAPSAMRRARPLKSPSPISASAKSGKSSTPFLVRQQAAVAAAR